MNVCYIVSRHLEASIWNVHFDIVAYNGPLFSQGAQLSRKQQKKLYLSVCSRKVSESKEFYPNVKEGVTID